MSKGVLRQGMVFLHRLSYTFFVPPKQFVFDVEGYNKVWTSASEECQKNKISQGVISLRKNNGWGISTVDCSLPQYARDGY